MVSGVCQENRSRMDIRFRLVRGTLVVVAMSANGIGPFDFVLDTGTDVTIVDQSFASARSLIPQGHLPQTTIVGRQTLTGSSIDMTLGTKVLRKLPVVIEDLASLRKVDARIQGIVGQNFLSHFNYLIDYRNGSIRLEEGSEIRDAIEGVRVPMELKGNMMIVEVEWRSAPSGQLHLTLDSGATSIMLMGDASKRLQIPIRENRSVLTLDGTVSVHAGVLHRLSVGSQEFRDIRAVLFPESVEVFGDGLLPTKMFQSVYINNRESFVLFNPRAKKETEISASPDPSLSQ
jgi:hypothetical protein